MSRKLPILLCVLACVLGMNGALWGQNAAAAHGIRGYLDPQTGMFHALPHPATSDAEVPATTTSAGKFVFTFTITVDATIATTAKIVCTATATVEDNLTGGSPKIILESASALATRSGTTATCTVNIPYSWNLATASTDSVTLGYMIEAPAEASATTILPSRTTSVNNFSTIKIPTASTTPETVTATF